MFKFNNTDISKFRLNSQYISSFIFNDTDIFQSVPHDEYIIYTFPNANAYMTSNSSLGFTVVGENKHSASTCNYRSAFDNQNDANHYTSSKSGAESFRIGLSLPFDVYLQSVSIADAPKTPAGSNAWYGFPYGGSIYTSKGARSALYTGTAFSNNNLDLWCNIGNNSRKTDKNGNMISSLSEYKTAYPDPTKHITTHTNINYSQKTRYIQYNPTWGGGDCKCIGEITLTFRVLRSDLEAWAEQYGVTIV